MTVADLKNAVGSAEDLPIDDLLLTHAGRPLEDDELLCGVLSNSAGVDVTLRIPGGESETPSFPQRGPHINLPYRKSTRIVGARRQGSRPNAESRQAGKEEEEDGTSEETNAVQSSFRQRRRRLRRSSKGPQLQPIETDKRIEKFRFSFRLKKGGFV